MRIVFDTNILVSIVIAKKNSNLYKIMEAWSLDLFEVIISNPILEELRNTLYKTEYFTTRINSGTIDNYLEFVQKYTIPQNIHTEIKTQELIMTYGFAPNQEDNFILSTVVDANAEYLITGDKKILQLGIVANTKIINPAQFVEILYRKRFLLD